jgi:hypothetical protein
MLLVTISPASAMAGIRRGPQRLSQMDPACVPARDRCAIDCVLFVVDHATRWVHLAGLTAIRTPTSPRTEPGTNAQSIKRVIVQPDRSNSRQFTPTRRHCFNARPANSPRHLQLDRRPEMVTD